MPEDMPHVERGPEVPDAAHEDNNYISLSDVAYELGRQTQYTSYCLTGAAGYPNLGEGLDFVEGSGGNYHATVIRRLDAEKFIRRILGRQTNN